MAPVNTVRVVLAIAVVLGANGCYRMERLSNAASDAGRDDANVRDASEGGLDGASSADASLPSDGGSTADAGDAGSLDPSVDATFCDPTLVGIDDAAVYADSRGVFVLVPGTERRLYRREPDGWHRLVVLPAATGARELVGVEGGPLFEIANGPAYSSCAIREVVGTDSLCRVSVPLLAGLDMVSSTSGYGAYRERAFHYDGTAFRQLGAPLPEPIASAVSADDTRIVFGLVDGVLVGPSDGSGFTKLVVPDLPPGSWPSSLGVARVGGDGILWTSQGQVRLYDGTAWSNVYASACASPFVDAGTFAGVPYFWGESYVGRLVAGAARIVGTLPCGGSARFTDATATADSVWAASVGHVGDACGELQVHRYAP